MRKILHINFTSRSNIGLMFKFGFNVEVLYRVRTAVDVELLEARFIRRKHSFLRAYLCHELSEIWLLVLRRWLFVFKLTCEVCWNKAAGPEASELNFLLKTSKDGSFSFAYESYQLKFVKMIYTHCYQSPVVDTNHYLYDIILWN